MRKSSFKQVLLVQTGTETSNRDEIGTITILFFVILLFSPIIHCIANFIWFPYVLFDLFTFFVSIDACFTIQFIEFLLNLILTGTIVNFYHISDDFERFYYLSLMLQYYTIDMPTRINQFVVNIDTLSIYTTVNQCCWYVIGMYVI